jgi:deoxycytidine triphosphate deaminase
MVLTSQEIAAKNIVSNGRTTGRRDTTYDATIGEIISCGKVIDGPSFPLPSRGVVWVVSNEEFQLPPDATGVASLKTSWAHEGVFALNVGVIDPGWTGPIATALVNFGRDEIIVKKDDAFLRVMFLSSNPIPTPRPPHYHNRSEYVKSIANKSRAFSNTFLNMAQIADEVGKEIFKLPKIAFWLTIAAIVISLLAMSIPIAISVATSDAHDEAVTLDLQNRLKNLEDRANKADELRQKQLLEEKKALDQKKRR